MKSGDSMFINTISPSKSDTYSQCKLKYYLRYHTKLVGTPKNESALNFGSFIHKIFEEGYQAKDIKTLRSLAERYRKEYHVSYSMNQKIDICISNFFRFNQKLEETLATELKYEVPIGMDMTQNGIIDRVIKGTSGGILVIDYKTSKREKTELTLLQDAQLKAYCHATSNLYKVSYDKIVCAHYYPMTNNFVKVRFNRSQINSFVKTETQRIWEIRKNKKEQFKPTENDFCNWCDYQEVCPQFVNPLILPQRLDELKKKK